MLRLVTPAVGRGRAEPSRAQPSRAAQSVNVTAGHTSRSVLRNSRVRSAQSWTESWAESWTESWAELMILRFPANQIGVQRRTAGLGLCRCYCDCGGKRIGQHHLHTLMR